MNSHLTDEELTKIVVDICFKIHQRLGPGLVEKVYEEVLCYELTRLGLRYQRQRQVAVRYDDLLLEKSFRYDVLVENKLLVELKSQDIISPVEYRIVRSYLRFLDVRLGLLVNFHVELIKDGFRRLVNRHYFDSLNQERT